MKKNLIFIIGSVLFITGCACKSVDSSCNYKQPTIKEVQPVIKKVEYNNNTCIISNKYKKSCILTLEAKGVGVPPCNATCSMPQAKMLARRAAILSAYRALAEKMYGIKINGKDTVKNMVLKNSTIRGYVEGLIRGANIVDEEFKNGVYTVVLELKLNVNEWNKYLEENYYN